MNGFVKTQHLCIIGRSVLNLVKCIQELIGIQKRAGRFVSVHVFEPWCPAWYGPRLVVVCHARVSTAVHECACTSSSNCYKGIDAQSLSRLYLGRHTWLVLFACNSKYTTSNGCRAMSSMGCATFLGSKSISSFRILRCVI